MAKRDTYKFHLKQGQKVIYRGTTKDLPREEAKFQEILPGTKTQKIGRVTTPDGAHKWEQGGGKRGYKKRS